MSSRRYSLPRSRAAILLSPGPSILGEATGLRPPQTQIRKGDQGLGGMMDAPTLHPVSALAFPPSSNMNAQGRSASTLFSVPPALGLPCLCSPSAPGPLALAYPPPLSLPFSLGMGIALWLNPCPMASPGDAFLHFRSLPYCPPTQHFQTGGLCSTVPQGRQRFP